MQESLGTELPKELSRARELIEQYAGLRGTPGVNVEFAITAINVHIDFAEKAMIEGDVVEMIKACNALKECQ